MRGVGCGVQCTSEEMTSDAFWGALCNTMATMASLRGGCPWPATTISPVKGWDKYLISTSLVSVCPGVRMHTGALINCWIIPLTRGYRVASYNEHNYGLT